jgi:precorrin-6y C5,15-methyltransferase (decarboxylating) CbiE subunit
MTERKISIVGCGPGGPEYVSPAARAAARDADVLLGAPRLLEMFPEHAGPKASLQGSVEQMLGTIAAAMKEGKRPTVLVSGDPGLFSLAQRIVERFGAAACHILPAVSSVQVAMARLGLGWADTKIVSAHGRSPDIGPAELNGFNKIAILAGTPEALAWCGRAAAELQATHVAFVCENLTLSDERIRRLDADEIASCGASSLCIVILVRKELTL